MHNPLVVKHWRRVYWNEMYDCLYKTTIDSDIGSLLDLYQNRQNCQMLTQNRNGSKVSRKVLRQYVQNDYQYTSSVTNMLRELKWSTLEQRRNRASLVMLDVTKDITNRSMSITVILKLQETTNSLWAYSFHGLYNFGTDYRLRFKCPNCSCICKWLKQVLCFLIYI